MQPKHGSPLYLQVTDSLRHEISKCAPGHRLETDISLSKRYSVSVSVIREALSILSREGIVTRHVGRGTFVENPRAGQRVAILCDMDITADGALLTLFLELQNSKRLLERAGWETAIYLGDQAPSATPPSGLTCQQFLKDLQSKQFAGVFSVWGLPYPSWTQPLENQGVPIVGIGPMHENMVVPDTDAFIRLSIQQLKSKGCRKIAILSCPSAWNVHKEDHLQYQRLSSLLEEAGLTPRPGWLRQDWHYSTKGGGWTSFREIWTCYQEKPDGIIVSHEAAWNDIRKAISSLQLEIPKDLQIAISRNAFTRTLWQIPEAIEVVFDSSRRTEAGVQMLLDLMEGKKPISTRLKVDAWSVIPPDHSAASPHQERSLTLLPASSSEFNYL